MIDPLIFAILLMAVLAFDLVTVAARAAFQESTYARLLGLREEFGESANRIISLYQTYSRVIASLNLLLLLARFLLAGGILIIFLQQAPAANWWNTLLVLLAAALVLFLFEHGAAAAVLRDPERSAIRFGAYLRFLVTICTPFVAFPLALSKDAAAQEDSAGSVTEDELKTMVDFGQEEGVLEQGERRMIYSVIDLGDTLAREIMVPRIDILTLEVSTPVMQAIDLLLTSGHSRLPVFEVTVDNTLGLLYAKDLLRVWREGGELESLRSLLRPAYYIPEAKKVNELLAEMQSQRIHMAIVVDEYGGIAGIVTLEDIVEEILGEIQDEYDQAEELPYQVLKNGDYLFLGRIDLDDFNEIMGSRLSKDEADTLGGYIYSQLGHVPEAGEAVQTHNLNLVVEQVSARRIRKVRACRVLPGEQNEEEKEDDHR